MATTVLPYSAETPESVFTATGTSVAATWLLSPSWPYVVVAPGGHGAVRAQRQAVAIARRDGHHRLAIQRRDPEAVFTATGTRRCSRVLSPSWPMLL